MCLYLSVHPTVCQSVCLFVCLFSVLFLSVSLSICLYVYRVCMRLLLLFEDTLIMLLRLAIGTDQGLSVVDTITNKCLYILSNLTSILCKHATSNILAFLYLCLHMCRFDKPRYKKREHSSNLLSQTHCHEASKPAVHVYTTVQSNLFVLYVILPYIPAPYFISFLNDVDNSWQLHYMKVEMFVCKAVHWNRSFNSNNVFRTFLGSLL